MSKSGLGFISDFCLNSKHCQEDFRLGVPVEIFPLKYVPKALTPDHFIIFCIFILQWCFAIVP